MYKITFNNTDHAFFQSVKISVEAYFVNNKLSTTGNWNLYVKALMFIPLGVAAYSFLLMGEYSLMGGLALTLLFVLCLVSIAFNVMHDACHGSYSKQEGLNDLMSLSMNVLGGNAFLWKITHNVIHHTYTNIDGIDHDIANWPLLRQCPTQPWRPMHRFQHFYMFLLYAFHTVAWMLVFDFGKYFSKKIATTPIKYMGVKDHFLFWASKLLYILFYIVLPIYFKGWQAWLIAFVIIHVTMGLVITMVFQLAHLVEKTSFEAAGEEPKIIESAWAVHEMRATANFAPQNKPLSWFLGGLNFQIEHHLFPQVSHIHYPALSKIVKEECARFNLPYHSYRTATDAIISHVRLMKKMGEKQRVGAAN